MKTNEFDWKLSSPHGRIYTRDYQGDSYLDGAVLTRHGIVEVYSQGGPSQWPSSNLTFVWNGRCYVRGRNRRLTKRGLVTAADRFAREIVEQNP